MRNTFLFFLLLCGSHLYGQNIHTTSIQWNSMSTFVINTGEMISEATIVNTYSDHIEWRASDGTLKYNLTILRTNGVWANISDNGQVIFEVDNEGKRGTAQFSKNAEGIKLKIILTGSDPVFFELTITNAKLL